MKYCANCEKELPSALDEYGDIREPVCRSCFFDNALEKQKAQDEQEQTLETIKENITEAREMIYYWEGVLWHLQIELKEYKNIKASKENCKHEEAMKRQPAFAGI